MTLTYTQGLNKFGLGKFCVGDTVMFTSEGGHLSSFKGLATIVDIVDYTGLIARKAYRLQFDDDPSMPSRLPYWDEDLVLVAMGNNKNAKRLLVKE